MPFNVVERVINPQTILYIVDIDSLTKELKGCIDKHISKIHSNNEFDERVVKKRISKFLTPKKGCTLETGGIAEFFVHLFLNEKQYKQECLYQNLEEGSPKKGFDGYYSKNGEEWIMESKSGDASSLSVSHKNNIKKAYKDLEAKVSGVASNNPWLNAYHHARSADSNQTLLDHVKKLSIDFDDDKFMDIKELNVIPSSVIFLNNQNVTLPTSTEADIKAWLLNKQYRKIHIVCITQKTKDIFLDYLQN